MEKLLSILEGIKPDVDFEGKTGLIENGDLDSFDIISLVSELNDEFEIDIPVEAIVPENFDSVETIMQLVNSLVEE